MKTLHWVWDMYTPPYFFKRGRALLVELVHSFFQTVTWKQLLLAHSLFSEQTFRALWKIHGNPLTHQSFHQKCSGKSFSKVLRSFSTARVTGIIFPLNFVLKHLVLLWRTQQNLNIHVLAKERTQLSVKAFHFVPSSPSPAFQNCAPIFRKKLWN